MIKKYFDELFIFNINHDCSGYGLIYYEAILKVIYGFLFSLRGSESLLQKFKIYLKFVFLSATKSQRINKKNYFRESIFSGISKMKPNKTLILRSP